MPRQVLSLVISPSYADGFTYLWDIAGDFNDPGPWQFEIQEGGAPEGPWRTISPILDTVFLWHESCRRSVNKSAVLYFRVSLKTPRGRYYSESIQPYGMLGKRDFLIARDIMRRSVLHARKMMGIECDVYLVSTFGPKCSHCIDPITGMVRDSHCKYCFGTGRYPAYHGPYRMWMEFSADQQHKHDIEQTGTLEGKAFSILAIGNPILKHNDVIVDVTSDKRYFIDSIEVVAEMRRIPIVQSIVAAEAPLSDKIYQLKPSK